ncbi:MAG: SGNH/GDSL hydrolase family protein [Comamonas sp.]
MPLASRPFRHRSALRLSAALCASLLTCAAVRAQDAAAPPAAPATPRPAAVAATAPAEEARSPDNPAPSGTAAPTVAPRAPARTVVPDNPAVPVVKPVPQAYVQWMTTMAQFAEADRAKPPPQDGVLFVGSSTVRLWSTLKADFPYIEHVINRGFGGSTMADNAYFVDRLVFPYRPRLLLIYAGDNDLAMGRGPERVLADFTAFFEAVRKELPQTRITYISIKPSPSRANLSAKIALTNALIQRFLETRPNTDYVDIYHPMLDGQGKPRPELFLQDQLHMNRAGYDIWKNVIAAHLPAPRGPLPPPLPPSTRPGLEAAAQGASSTSGGDGATPAAPAAATPATIPTSGPNTPAR